MRKRYFLFSLSILLLLVVCNKTYATVGGGVGLRPSNPPSTHQQLTIRGQVTDESGVAFPGVNIVVKGTTNGTVTGSDGSYSIDVPSASTTLVFSFVGYALQEVSIDGKTTINVSLVPDITSLEEVLVTALGVKKESKKLGYAVASVSGDELVKSRTTNVMASLEGKVAGLDISPPSSGPGGSTKIRLRGQVAFSGGTNSPLIVLNGLPMDQGALGADGSNATRDRGDGMQNINPDDIETMTVLKGATAAALYGSRAANGAIIITTKSGQKGQGVGIEYTSDYTVSKALDYTDLQMEYGAGDWNVAQAKGLRPATAAQATSLGMYGWGEKLDGEATINFDGVSRPYSADRNRVTDFYRDGKAFTNTIALSAGNEKGSFRASFSNLKSNGITPNNEYSKKIANIGFNYDITKKLKITVNANYGHEENVNPPQVGVQGNGEANYIYRMANSTPLSAFKGVVLNPSNGITENPTNGFQTTLTNPYFSMSRLFFKENKNRLLATTTLRYQFTDWLYLQGRYNYDYSVSNREFNVPTGIGTNNPFNGTGTGYNGSYNVNTDQGSEINADFLLGANKQFGDFSVDVSLGGNTYRTNYGFTSQGVTDFVELGIYSLQNGVTSSTNSYSIDRRRVNSFYGVAEIGYKGMIYLSVTDRQDWFSVLNPANNTKNYPSVSGSFIFSEVLEQSWLSYGKLRGSWAQVGSASGVGFNQYQLNYSLVAAAFNGQKLGTINNTSSPNPFLQPFTVTEKEIGLETKFFNRRLGVDIAAYDKTSTDQILPVAISNASGYGTTLQNTGSLRNRGMEFLIDIVPVERGNFRWTTSFNTAYNKSKVLSLAPGVNRFVQTSFGGNEFLGQLVYEVGQPLNQLSAKTYKRDANGNILFNNAGLVQGSANYVSFGSGLPTLTGGWSNTLSYKKLSLMFMFDWKAGGKIMSSSNLNWTRQGLSKESLVGRDGINFGVDGIVESTGLPYAGTPINPRTFYTQYRTEQIGDPFIYKGDFIKLR
ncbi:MAG: SusC/RagA family TonB-linked outer membrane protein, partial [Chryseolinea sp.]